MKLKEICDRLGYHILGNDSIDIKGVRFSAFATPYDLAIAFNSTDIQQTKAKAILCEPAFLLTDKTLILPTDDLELASIKISNILIASKVVEGYSALGEYRSYNSLIDVSTTIGINSVIGKNVVFGKNCIIGPGVFIGNGTVLGDNVTIEVGASVGSAAFFRYHDNGLKVFPGIGRVILGNDVYIGCNSIIQKGTFGDTIIGSGSKIGDGVVIGHDVQIGQNCTIVTQCGISSRVILGDNVTVFGHSGVAEGVNIGNDSIIYAMSCVTKNFPQGSKISGIYAREHFQNLRKQVKR